VPKLKRYETDDVAGDRGLMHSKFPELDEGTVPYQPNCDLPTATVKQDNVCYITTVDGAKNYAKGAIDIMRQHTSDGDVCYGFDAEWVRGASNDDTPVFTFSFPWMGDLLLLHIPDMPAFPVDLRSILELPRMVARCEKSIRSAESALLDCSSTKMVMG
jgi:hypothetical protein